MSQSQEALRIHRKRLRRFNKEIQIFERRWPDIMRDGDPYYNPNLTLKSQDFSLKRI